MLSAAAWLAALLYLLPVIVLLVVRARRERPLWEVALDIPLAIALDFAIILSLSRVVTVETAALLSRGVWVLGGVVIVVWRAVKRGVRPAWPGAITLRVALDALMGTALSAGLSMVFSRSCHGFDRGWHIPLSTSLRGQTLPFQNVYEPGRELAYHFTGDVLATTIQSLSGATIHSTLALSIGHDIMFGLTGLTATLLLGGLGVGGRWPAGLLAQAPILAGPLTVLLSGRRFTQGHNFLGLLKISFRPHTALAILLIAGFVGALVVRLENRASTPPPVLRTGLVLVACTAVLSVSDEASIGMLGLCVGMTWLVFPEILAQDRKQGMAVLAALLATVIGANLLFHGVLAEGGVGQEVALVPSRAPGYYRPPLSLRGARGWTTLFYDCAPTALVWIGGLVATIRDRTRPRVAFTVFASLFFSLAFVLLTHVDIGERSVESHRFANGALVVAGMGGLAWLAPAMSPGSKTKFGVAHLVILAGMLMAGVSNADWLLSTTRRGSVACPQPALYFAKQNLFDVNCRSMVGGGLGLANRTLYLDKPIAYAVAGCIPVFTSGPPPTTVISDRLDLAERGPVSTWDAKIGRMLVGPTALIDLHQDMVDPDEPLEAACVPDSTDRVCVFAAKKELCEPMGEVLLCTIPPPERDELMAPRTKKRRGRR